jgi:hypothetical protein
MNASNLTDNLSVLINFFSNLLKEEYKKDHPNTETIAEINIAITTLEQAISLIIDTQFVFKKWSS